MTTPRSGNRLFSSRHETFGAPRFPRVVALLRVGNDRKKRERRNAGVEAGLSVREQEIDALPRDARKGGDRFLALRAVEDEHGVDEILGGQSRFAREPSRELDAAHAARPLQRKFSVERERHRGTSSPARARPERKGMRVIVIICNQRSR